jgi:hypothetical protein
LAGTREFGVGACSGARRIEAEIVDLDPQLSQKLSGPVGLDDALNIQLGILQMEEVQYIDAKQGLQLWETAKNRLEISAADSWAHVAVNLES